MPLYEGKRWNLLLEDGHESGKGRSKDDSKLSKKSIWDTFKNFTDCWENAFETRNNYLEEKWRSVSNLCWTELEIPQGVDKFSELAKESSCYDHA